MGVGPEVGGEADAGRDARGRASAYRSSFSGPPSLTPTPHALDGEKEASILA